jgi:C4-dicarboxylate-specific signal transduction histidine kinase
VCSSDLVQGGKGFLVYAPVHRGASLDDFGGFVLGVYRIEPLLDLVLANVSPAHGVSVEANGERAWSRHADCEDDPRGVALGTLSLPGTAWQIAVWSPSPVRSLYLSPAPTISLIVGIALSFLLAFALRQTLFAQQRSEHLTLAMTERVRAERELVRAHDELDDRVQARTSELVQTNERLSAEIIERERAEERARENQDELAQVLRRVMMGEMATGLAHELTQPLAAIANYAEACSISLRNGEVDHAHLEQALTEVTAHTRHAGEVIHRLRELLRKRETQRVELPAAEIVDQAVRLVAPDAASKAIDLTIEVERELHVDADPIQIEQVLLNLLRNSIDAMAQAETPDPRVSLTVAESSKGRVELTVSDNGPGLSDESLARMFEPFFTTKERGLGMGLSISRTIIEAHGGQLHFVRNGDSGAAFRFDLPGTTRTTSDG